MLGLSGQLSSETVELFGKLILKKVRIYLPRHLTSDTDH